MFLSKYVSFILLLSMVNGDELTGCKNAIVYPSATCEHSHARSAGSGTVVFADSFTGTWTQTEASSNCEPWTCSGFKKKCFPENSMVITRTGRKFMYSLSVGDEILDIDGGFTKVIGWNHRKRHVWNYYVRIDDLEVSPNHIILHDGKYKFAGEVAPSTLYLRYGIYSPVTESGTLVVNNFPVSAHSNFVSHYFHRVIKLFVHTDESRTIHPKFRGIEDVLRYILPSFFYM